MRGNILVILAISFITLMLTIGCESTSNTTKQVKPIYIASNPIDLDYRYQPDGTPRRDAGDPVIEFFNGKYYLFASNSGGYWSSPNLKDWNYIACKTIKEIDKYPPCILIHDDYCFYLTSGSRPQLFRTKNPDEDKWEKIAINLIHEITDPSFFKDDNGKIYLFWGCSDRTPIVGVEVDPENGLSPLSAPKTLITHRTKEHGWEAPGKNNEESGNGWNEGPKMIKYNNIYYLQYSAPGKRFRTYASGAYYSDSPLGPFKYMENSPFSFKPSGFIGGAGHGHIFQDKYGNYWNVASMKISVRNAFERRIGLFPVYFSNNGIYQQTVFADYPFTIPAEPTDFKVNRLTLNWNLLSYQKNATASSSLNEHSPEYATNESIESWWAAKTGNSGEWLQIDLGNLMTVNAIQVNFADHGFKTRKNNSVYQYYIEYSEKRNGDWERLIDKTNNTADSPHELIVLSSPVKARYIRITNSNKLPGNFSISGLRIFGNNDKGRSPQEVTDIKIKRDSHDRRMISFSWENARHASGYILRWGINKDELNNAQILYSNKETLRFFNCNTQYYFAIDAFNETGITKGESIIHVK